MKIVTAIATLKSLSPYSQSRFTDQKKKPSESYEDFENRTWLDKGHYTPDGFACIPMMALKTAICAGAKFKNKPMKGKQTYTKHFVSGVLPMKDAKLNVRREDVTKDAVLCASDGKKGGKGGSSVVRVFPVIPSWECEAEFAVIDELIGEAVFREMLEAAGQFIGFGRFRVENGGYYGRFLVTDLKWVESTGGRSK